MEETYKQHFEKNKQWSDQFTPKLMQILGPQVLRVGTPDEDKNECGDLVLRIDQKMYPIRVRRNSFYNKFYNDFALSENISPITGKTEVDKIVEGYGQYYVYSFTNIEETDIEYWRIYDLNVFRLWIHRCLLQNKGVMPGISRMKNARFSKFRTFDVSEIPNMIVDQSKNYKK